MIAHFEDGTSRKISTGFATMGMRVVRWEFDAHDMRDLLANPELLPILATRMPPTSPQREWQGLTDEEEILETAKNAWGKDKLNQGRSDLKPFYIDFARAIEAKLKEKNV